MSDRIVVSARIRCDADGCAARQLKGEQGWTGIDIELGPDPTARILKKLIDRIELEGADGCETVIEEAKIAYKTACMFHFDFCPEHKDMSEDVIKKGVWA
jgi:hypothetical protein